MKHLIAQFRDNAPGKVMRAQLRPGHCILHQRLLLYIKARQGIKAEKKDGPAEQCFCKNTIHPSFLHPSLTDTSIPQLLSKR